MKLKLCPFCLEPTVKKSCINCKAKWQVRKPQIVRQKCYKINRMGDKSSYQYLEKIVQLHKVTMPDLKLEVWMAIHDVMKQLFYYPKKVLMSKKLVEKLKLSSEKGNKFYEYDMEGSSELPDPFGILIDCSGDLAYIKLEGLD